MLLQNTHQEMEGREGSRGRKAAAGGAAEPARTPAHAAAARALRTAPAGVRRALSCQVKFPCRPGVFRKVDCDIGHAACD